ncbi:MAG: metalloregulator ArsR/SmtB family transcription factor [Actinomycetota bacterium]|nr:metalloregulator ArsR/SmtB family transcription factor [Actinomycetota bacterium]MDQ6945431.1 metalloregulator ArsR/SmtB family transcription factor [Actinomycetota bacterium]
METEPRYPQAGELQLTEILHALSDPVRLQIVRILDEAAGARACVDIRLPVSKSTGSHHYKVLREAGIVQWREEGTRRYYTIRRNDLESRFPGLLDTVLRAATTG